MKENSVKSLRIIQPATDELPGLGEFVFLPVFSVFDWGRIEPPIPLDNSTIALQAAYNFEMLESRGIPTHYQYLCHDHQALNVNKAIRNRITDVSMRVQVVKRILPEWRDGWWKYDIFRNPRINNYVIPIEFIVRHSLPEASSIWKRIDSGFMTPKDLHPDMPDDIKPGVDLPVPFLDYSTKYEDQDTYLSRPDALLCSGLEESDFSRVERMAIEASNHIKFTAASRGIQHIDGKMEFAVINKRVGHIVLADVVGTLHEDRFVYKGISLSKQILRDAIRESDPAWCEEVERAKKESSEKGTQDFRRSIRAGFQREPILPPVSLFNWYNNMSRAFVNNWVGSRVYDTATTLEELDIVVRRG